MWSAIRWARKLPVGPPVNAYFDAGKAHHLPTGFRNLHPDRPPTERELAEARARLTLPPAPATALETVTPDLAFLHANRAAPTMTWIGHSTVLVQMGGKNIITDPIFAKFASPLSFAGPKRRQPPGIALARLPRIDLVVVSHNHYDHASRPCLRALARQPGGPPHFAVPLGMADWFARRVTTKAPVVALDWWDSATVDGIRMTLCPAHHWSARTPWNRNHMLWGSWAVEAGGFRFWFSGDLAYSKDAEDIGERLGPFDAAAVAIGHYEPRAFLKNHHVNPDEAVRVHKEVRSRRTLAIHWGTFDWLTPAPLYQPLLDLMQARREHAVSDAEFFTLRHGETAML